MCVCVCDDGGGKGGGSDSGGGDSGGDGDGGDGGGGDGGGDGEVCPAAQPRRARIRKDVNRCLLDMPASLRDARVMRGRNDRSGRARREPANIRAPASQKPSEPATC